MNDVENQEPKTETIKTTRKAYEQTIRALRNEIPLELEFNDDCYGCECDCNECCKGEYHE